MMTVNEVSGLTGVSIRTLHYYDEKGLLHPAKTTDAGYRLYDDTDLEKLQQILLFRELEFPLKEIKSILESDSFDRNRALKQQIDLLTLKKEHLENLICFARGLKSAGGKNMDFKAFDTSKIDEYTKKAKEQWGQTEAYREFEKKHGKRSNEETSMISERFMDIFRKFGTMMGLSPSDAPVQVQVRKLQDYITENFYTCTDQILEGLGKMYAGGGEFTENIDSAGGTGCAVFTAKAIETYVSQK